MPQDDAIARLAKQIDAVRQSERFLVNADEVAKLRRQGACRLHEICAQFVSSLNSKLSIASIEISPDGYSAEMFQEPGVNLIQISSVGRTIQITFQSTAKLFSTEKFLIPYVLEGEVRAYNQKMLERFDVRSQSLFYCIEENTAIWRFFDWRGPRTALLDQNLLATLLEGVF